MQDLTKDKMTLPQKYIQLRVLYHLYSGLDLVIQHLYKGRELDEDELALQVNGMLLYYVNTIYQRSDDHFSFLRGFIESTSIFHSEYLIEGIVSSESPIYDNSLESKMGLFISICTDLTNDDWLENTLDLIIENLKKS